MLIEDALLRAQEAAAPEVGRGRLAGYIPSLASVDPHQFGMAIASCDGEVHVIGDADVRLTGDARGALRDLMRRESGRTDVDSDPEVARSELAAGHRTLAVAHLLASYGNLECPVDQLIHQYVAQCALSMTCRELALAGLFLARDGMRSAAGCRPTASPACGVPPWVPPAARPPGWLRSTRSRRTPTGRCSETRRTAPGCGAVRAHRRDVDGYSLSEARRRRMSSQPNDPDSEHPGHETGQEEAAGVEIGSTDGEGSTFEPEEDPEGHAG
ncbi:MAG TPA: glutaminase [Nocardioides sp.]|nr:glutaminase [Nocardioides sp.]